MAEEIAEKKKKSLNFYHQRKKNAKKGQTLCTKRFDLGKCPKIHDVALRADFEKSCKYEYDYQVEAYQLLKNFLAESQRRSQVAKARLAITQDILNIEEGKKIDYICQIDNKINNTLKKVESLGTVGSVEESLNLMKEVDLLREEKTKTVANFKSQTPASLSQQKKLRVCEVCSSYLGLNDDDKRLSDHFSGKLHLGFLYIREKYEELESLIQDRCIKAVLDSEFKSCETYKRSRSNHPASQSKYLRYDHNDADSECKQTSKEKLIVGSPLRRNRLFQSFDCVKSAVQK